MSSSDVHRPLRRAALAMMLTSAGFPITANTLAKLAALRSGPEYRIWGKYALYDPQKAFEWARARLALPNTRPAA